MKWFISSLVWKTNLCKILFSVCIWESHFHQVLTGPACTKAPCSALTEIYSVVSLDIKKENNSTVIGETLSWEWLMFLLQLPILLSLSLFWTLWVLSVSLLGTLKRTDGGFKMKGCQRENDTGKITAKLGEGIKKHTGSKAFWVVEGLWKANDMKEESTVSYAPSLHSLNLSALLQVYSSYIHHVRYPRG